MRLAPLLLASLLASGALACAHKDATAPPQAAAGPLTPAQIAKNSLPAVVTMRTAQSLGTGFIVRADGWIATNLHVVVGGPKVKVTLRDGRDFDVVEVLAASPQHDLALVRVEAHGLPTVSLGDSDAMQPGDPVVAIGNPMGLEDTVSNGLVSARRKVNDDLEVLQVSAPIAPGSSGGPIFNDKGQVIGVATAILREGQNLNFGVPVRYLAPMIAQPSPMKFSDFATLMAQIRAASTPQHAHVRREVPRWPVSMLEGCSIPAQKLVVKMLGDAIEAGAPLFNAGKPVACYHVYDGAASDLERKLPPACKGPAKALSDAQKKAASLPDPAAQAWALRDGFDGVLDVITRGQQQ